MATKHGSGLVTLIGSLLMSAYFNQADISRSCDTAEDTAFGDTSKTYIPGLHDGNISLAGMWDPVASGSAAILNTALGTADTIISLILENSIGGRAKIAKCIETSHDVDAPVGDLVTAGAELQGDGGVWGGDVICAGSALTVTGFGASANNGVATTEGWVANLHMTVIAGSAAPTLTAKLADSADDSSFADVSGGGFTAMTAIGAQQITSAAGTLRQYARLAYTISGTTPSFTVYAVVARR